MPEKSHHVPAKASTALRGACPISPEKVRYSERSMANRALTNARASGHAVIKVYRCGGCRGFHLTKIRESEWTTAYRHRGGAEA